jgi:GT2 family glycosyltransferase
MTRATGSRTRRASVIVVTYNHVLVIDRCLTALVETVGLDDEIIVIDNASRDGTPSLIGERYPHVRLVRSTANSGFGAACNRAAAEAAGTYLVFINPDTEARPGWLDALLEGLDQSSDVGLATAKVVLAQQPELMDTFGNEVHISGLTTSRHWGEPAERFTRTEDVSAVSGACFAVRSLIFKRLGGFDERLFLYFEDTDLSLRARLAGYRCVGVPRAIVLHDHKPGFTPSKLRYLERNRWWTLLKVCRLRTLVALIPVLLMAEVLAWGLAVRSGPWHVVAKARAWVDLVRWLPHLPSARAQAEMLRVRSDRQVWLKHTTRLSFAQVSGRVVEPTVERLFGLGRLIADRVGLDGR